MSGEEISARIAFLRDTVKMKRNYASAINDRMLNLSILKKFSKSVIDSGHQMSRAEAKEFAEQWMADNYGDDPSTKKNEAISPDKLDAVFKDMFGFSLLDLNSGTNVSEADFNAKFGDEDALKQQFRSLYAMRERFKNDAEAIRNTIDSLHQAKQEEAGATSG